MAGRLNPRMLFAAIKITTKFVDKDNGELIKETQGSGFFIGVQNKPVLITNRHVIDINYRSKKNYPHAKLDQLTIGQVGWDSSLNQPTEFKESLCQTCNFFFPPNEKVD
ncbi:MAG: hypothetical protein JNM24_09445 [Bdellovibrionaceae bacterium]|nr:hypothetical protein [Pseudobdellovibrionaceae bacterium]